jgi:hypothetical protein
MEKLFEEQVSKLKKHHYLILYWAAEAEVAKRKYNITNVFDDLKALGITRTKQSAVSYIDVLEALCFIDVKEERNRKNIYISSYGETALEKLVSEKQFKIEKSTYLGGSR